MSIREDRNEIILPSIEEDNVDTLSLDCMNWRQTGSILKTRSFSYSGGTKKVYISKISTSYKRISQNNNEKQGNRRYSFSNVGELCYSITEDAVMEPIRDLRLHSDETFDKKESVEKIPHLLLSSRRSIENSHMSSHPNPCESNPDVSSIQPEPVCNDSIIIYNDSSSEDESHSKLNNLNMLFQKGFISNTEFKARRAQLVDELSKEIAGSFAIQLPVIIKRPPPNFDLLQQEGAIKYCFNYHKRKWTTTPIFVKLDNHPFAKGGLRMVYHLQDLSLMDSEVDSNVSYVAKIAIDPNENADTYFKDVEMQAVAAEYADLFNSYNPPRKVEFLTAWILQLTNRDGVLCGVEPYIQGDYQKHNNNCGYVSDLERNTPQAFSHFTFEASKHEILVVDIQGVGDHYTDPQIHTRSGEEFGKGNLSFRGYEKFLSTHRCNPICRYLKLPLINPKDRPQGTIPAQPFMTQPRINPVVSELKHYYGNIISSTGGQFQSREESKIRYTPPVSRSCTWCGVETCSIQ